MKQLYVLVAVALVAGCATAKHDEPVVPSGHRDPAIQALRRSAEEIQKSWNVIGAIDMASREDGRQLLSKDAGAFSGGLARVVTLRYSGDIRAAAIELARAADATFVETGKRPATAIPVHIEVDGVPIGSVLRDIGYQAGARAGIRVSSGATQVVELLYVSSQN